MSSVNANSTDATWKFEVFGNVIKYLLSHEYGHDIVILCLTFTYRYSVYLLLHIQFQCGETPTSHQTVRFLSTWVIGYFLSFLWHQRSYTCASHWAAIQCRQSMRLTKLITDRLSCHLSADLESPLTTMTESISLLQIWEYVTVKL